VFVDFNDPNEPSVVGLKVNVEIKPASLAYRRQCPSK